MRRSPFFAAAFALFAIAPSFARAAEPVDKDAASMLPQEVRARGFVTMASAGINIPHSYVDEKDNKTVIGIEPELVREAARRLGLDLKIEVTAFNGIVAGLQSGRFDLAASSLADSVDRERSMDGSERHLRSARQGHRGTDGRQDCGAERPRAGAGAARLGLPERLSVAASVQESLRRNARGGILRARSGEVQVGGRGDLASGRDQRRWTRRDHVLTQF